MEEKNENKLKKIRKRFGLVLIGSKQAKDLFANYLLSTQHEN